MLDRDVALLADVPSAQWNEVLRRQAIVDGYDRLTKPTGEDAERHAELLGLSLRSFYRLVRSHDLLKKGDRPVVSRRGSHRHAPPALDRIVEETRRDLGAETPDRVVRLEIGRRCQAAGLSPPSQNAVRIRANGSPIDLRIRLGRRCDLVLDVCPLVLDVIEDSDTPNIATLSALLRAEDGALVAHGLTSGPPDASRLLALVHRAVPPRSGDVTLVSTGAGAETLGTVADALRGTNIAFDAASSRGLQRGSAIGPALGHLIRRVPLAPRRKAPAAETTPMGQVRPDRASGGARHVADPGSHGNPAGRIDPLRASRLADDGDRADGRILKPRIRTGKLLNAACPMIGRGRCSRVRTSHRQGSGGAISDMQVGMMICEGEKP